MTRAAIWWGELRRVVWILLAVSLVGWLLGNTIPALMLGALLLVAMWLYQLWRVSSWLQDPIGEPPAASGLWGEVFNGVSRLRRWDREERDRLQSAVSYLRESFAALKEAAVMVDPEGRIEWSNASAERLLGLQYPRDHGQLVLDLLRIPNFHSYTLSGEFDEPLQLTSPLDDGVKLIMEITPFGIGSQLILARDNTREQRLESMRRDFVANVSHELRTPLTVITGYLHTMLDNRLAENEKIQSPLEQMRQQAERMETLLHDLLWLSRLEFSEGQENFELVDMRDILLDVQQHFQEAYPERTIELSIDCECHLEGNHDQLYSAVSNLVVNALKYSEDDIELNWKQADGKCLLSVVDQGPGIKPVHLPRLTERFYRVDKSRSQETGGTGLGLAIVKHILAGHGAYLQIESKVGVGSRFCCVFPTL
ncbi:MAG: phosphate regulon sensor histidine kinase PhoR [Halieaceae bacterium]|nr:phosphate regulon sensor histidine kinase PhoR [Halieaceae bacterium]